MYESVPQKAIILMTLYFHALREPSFQINVQNTLLKAEASRSYREDVKLQHLIAFLLIIELIMAKIHKHM